MILIILVDFNIFLLFSHVLFYKVLLVVNLRNLIWNGLILIEYQIDMDYFYKAKFSIIDLFWIVVQYDFGIYVQSLWLIPY
jgi:hypothetical protein